MRRRSSLGGVDERAIRRVYADYMKRAKKSLAVSRVHGTRNSWLFIHSLPRPDERARSKCHMRVRENSAAVRDQLEV